MSVVDAHKTGKNALRFICVGGCFSGKMTIHLCWGRKVCFLPMELLRICLLNRELQSLCICRCRINPDGLLFCTGMERQQVFTQVLPAEVGIHLGGCD